MISFLSLLSRFKLSRNPVGSSLRIYLESYCFSSASTLHSTIYLARITEVASIFHFLFAAQPKYILNIEVRVLPSRKQYYSSIQNLLVVLHLNFMSQSHVKKTEISYMMWVLWLLLHLPFTHSSSCPCFLHVPQTCQTCFYHRVFCTDSPFCLECFISRYHRAYSFTIAYRYRWHKYGY